MSNKDEYVVISLISSNMKHNEEILNKEILVIYDEILPDLYVNIELNDSIKKKYGISKKCKVNSVLYDVYVDRIKSVKVVFVDGTIGIYDVNYIEESRDDELYCCTWQIPMIKIEFGGISLDVSLLELMNKGVKVFIKEYK